MILEKYPFLWVSTRRWRPQWWGRTGRRCNARLLFLASTIGHGNGFHLLPFVDAQWQSQARLLRWLATIIFLWKVVLDWPKGWRNMVEKEKQEKELLIEGTNPSWRMKRIKQMKYFLKQRVFKYSVNKK